MEEINNFNQILSAFKIKAQCINFKKMNNYSFYDLKLALSAKIKDIQKISDEIALCLQAPGKPSIKIIHEQGIVRIEFANHNRPTTALFPNLHKDNVPNGDLVCLLGHKVNGDNLWTDIAQSPHMLIAGATGSGKSTLLHNIIANSLYHNNAEIHLVDPKGIEFSEYENKFDNISIRYDYNSCLDLIDGLIEIMNVRYDMLRTLSNVNIKPYLVIIDEFADLIMQDKDERLHNSLCILAQKSRAAKIHLVLSTQRPTASIINGNIKANFPARIACKVSSHVDSKVILDASGAEHLYGRGDAIIRDNSNSFERFQIYFTSAKDNVKFFKN